MNSNKWNKVSRAKALAAGTVLVLGLGLGAAPAGAEPMDQKVDLTHTSIYFSYKHGGFSNVRGLFRTVNSIEFTFDPDNVANSKVKAVVDTASLDTNHDYRDNFSKTPDFLNVKDHPTMTFESTDIAKTGDNTGTMTGNLTIRDVTKPVTFDVVYNKGGKHISGKYDIDGFTATSTLKRSEFGIDAFVPWVSDEIEIVIDLEAHR